MSRLGKKPVVVPSGVTVDIKDKTVHVKGPKGQLELTIQKRINIKKDESVLNLSLIDDEHPKFLGLYRTLVFNMIEGVSKGFEKKLNLVGVGFKAQVSGTKLIMSLGFSHPCEFEIPKGLEVKVEKNVQLTVSGSDKQQVGQFASTLKHLRKPEPYKGKGVHYVGEYIRKKAGKSAAKK